MSYRIIIYLVGLLTLTMCQNQKRDNTADSQQTTGVLSTSTAAPTKSNPVKNNKETIPELSDGLPPDEEAVRIAKEEQEKAMNKNSEIIYLEEGENRFLKEYEMNVTFKSVLEDSRCPKGVNCIWAGVATAEVELMGISTRPRIIKVSTINDAKKNYSKTQNFNGYSITLANITPAPTSEKGYKSLQGTYKIGLRFAK